MSTRSEYTSPADRLRVLQFNAALATLAGDDMTTLDAAATLETCADLLGDALALCRLVDVASRCGGVLPPGAAELARNVVRRADGG